MDCIKLYLGEQVGRLLVFLRAAYAAEGLVDMMETGLSDTSEAVMLSLDHAYGPGWSYAPLAMDLEYAMGGEDEGWNPGQPGLPGLPGENEGEPGFRRRFLNRVEEAWKVVFGEGLEWGARRLLANDSFSRQRNELTALKALYPDRVYPFLGIDPRRQHIDRTNLVELTGDYVGPGRPFTGIKLYTSSGFSPTDPALFDRGGLYEHCRRQRIPVTVHFGSGGFATPLSSVTVRGDVYHPLYGDIVPVRECYPDGRVTFEVKMSPGTIGMAVRERQMRLNHPRLWEKVLDRWPGLVINFAHAGGSYQAGDWLEHSRYPNWTRWSLRQAARRRGVYVDLSSHAGTDVDFPRFAEAVRKRYPALRRKILYGSDYFLTHLKDPDIRAYRDRHRESFGGWWRAMSITNPGRFLRH